MHMLIEGIKAPEFSLRDKDGNIVSLRDFAGKKIVLYFYPKDHTPGCTIQAQAFRDAYEEFAKLGIIVIGVSKDSVKSHQKFCSDYNLPFILLSDEDRKAHEAYDVLEEGKMYGKPVIRTLRTTFLIDEVGTIERIWEKVDPAQNASDILNYLKQ